MERRPGISEVTRSTIRPFSCGSEFADWENANCARCGAQLSRYRAPDEPDGICAACASKAPEAAPTQLLEAEELTLAVASVLLAGAVLEPERRVHVQAALYGLGIFADHIDVHKAVCRLRRRYGWRVEAREGEPGYRVTRWPYKFTRRRRSGQLLLFGKGR